MKKPDKNDGFPRSLGSSITESWSESKPVGESVGIGPEPCVSLPVESSITVIRSRSVGVTISDGPGSTLSVSGRNWNEVIAKLDELKDMAVEAKERGGE